MADDPRHDQRRSDRGEADFRLAEHGAVGGDGKVAHHRQFAARAHGVALHRGDHRLGQSPRGEVEIQRPQMMIVGLEPVPLARFPARVMTDIGAGAERLAGAAEHHHGDLIVRFGAAEGLDQAKFERGAERVALVRAVHGDIGDGFVDFVQDEFLCHDRVSCLALILRDARRVRSSG